MNKWNEIYNPLNGRYINLNSNEGHNILRNYLNQFMKNKTLLLKGGGDSASEVQIPRKSLEIENYYLTEDWYHDKFHGDVAEELGNLDNKFESMEIEGPEEDDKIIEELLLFKKKNPYSDGSESLPPAPKVNDDESNLKYTEITKINYNELVDFICDNESNIESQSAIYKLLKNILILVRKEKITDEKIDKKIIILKIFYIYVKPWDDYTNFYNEYEESYEAPHNFFFEASMDEKILILYEEEKETKTKKEIIQDILNGFSSKRLKPVRDMYGVLTDIIEILIRLDILGNLIKKRLGLNIEFSKQQKRIDSERYNMDMATKNIIYEQKEFKKKLKKKEKIKETLKEGDYIRTPIPKDKCYNQILKIVRSEDDNLIAKFIRRY